MKAALFYFSATGNTEKIAELYAAELTKAGADVTCFPLPTDNRPDLNGYDVIGIGYPIHSFNAPELVLKFARKIARRNNAEPAPRVFVFKSSGEPVRMSDVSSLKLRKILAKRGYPVTNEYQYVMPYNIIFRHTDGEAYRMWTTAKKLVPVDTAELLSGKKSLPRKMFLGGFLAMLLRCEHWGAHICGITFGTNKNCAKCGKCVKACPTKNIRLTKDRKLKFGWRCAICMRCVFKCPKDGITPGMLNGWKVNGEYTFEQPTECEQPTKHSNYCKKAYDRYYAAAEEKCGGNADKGAHND